MNVIIKNKYLFFFTALLIALPFLVKAPFVKTIDNVDYFNIKDHPDTFFYNDFKKEFGNDEFFIISYQKDNIFTKESLIKLKKITDEIEMLPEVREVKSLANVDDTIGDDEYFIVEKLLEEIPDNSEDLELIKKRALSNPLYLKNIISKDGKTAGIVVSVFERPDDPEYRKRLVHKVETILSKYKDYTGKVYMAGWTTTNLYLSQYMKKDISSFIPISYLFIIVAIFIFFRNPWILLISVMNISICMGSTMGLLPLFNITLNNVTTIVPPVVMALALCDTVHIFSALDRDLLVKMGSKEKALEYVLKKLFVPCFLTSLTTCIGFASLCISHLEPVKDFGKVAAIGMVFELFFAFTFLPALLMFFPEDKIFQEKRKNKRIISVLEKTGSLVIKNFKVITLSGFFLIFISVFFSSRIEVETNLMKYFKKNSIVQKANDFTQENLAGIGTLEISLKTEVEEGFKYPENLLVIEKMQNFIDKIDGVDKTMTFTDFLKDMNQSFHNEDTEFYTIPETMEMVSQYLLIYDSDDIEDFINSDYNHARISLRLSKHSTKDHKYIIESINKFKETIDNDNIEIRVTGRALQDVNIIDALVKGQIYSLALASGIIITIMFFILSSFSLGCLSIIPNLFPIIVNFGIMGLFRVPLNTATALIAAVAIGIAVDDTIHFLN